MKHCWAVALLALSLTLPAYAQSSDAGAAADGPPHIVSLSHFIHATDKLETTTGFYHDVFGAEIPEPRPFNSEGPALLNNVPGLTLRIQMTAFQPDKVRMEFTEFHNVDKKGAQALPTDPGAPELILRVRDMDAVMAALKKCSAPIVTKGGAPVKINTPDGPRRAIVVRDPDGYLVRVIEVSPAEATTPGQLQSGISLGVGVQDMDATIKFYHDDLGMNPTGDMKFAKDKMMSELVGAPGKAEYREASFVLPKSNAKLIFWEWKGMPRTKFHERVPDPGAGGFVAQVSDLPAMMKMFRAQNIHIESKDAGPVWFSKTVLDVFIEDPNGINLELFQNMTADQAKAAGNSGN
jgi:catechol 2,3-dioxygenase-like lactoylglutathione lyase family enzyme